MKPEITKKDDGSLTLKITISAQDVQKAREEVTDELVKHVSLPGFRKGKVPSHIAKEKLSKELVQEEVLKKVVPAAYNVAIKEAGINPIIQPKLHIETFDEGTGVVFEAETAEMPQVKLGKYKEAISKITAKSKIVVPGKEEKKPNLDELMSAALEEIQVTIPQVLKEQEASRLLSQMLDELKTLGLTLDQYLASRSKTGDQLRSEYEEKAEKDLKLEFFLRTVADEEKITVEPKDIEEALNGVEDVKQREEIAKNPYFVANIIRQQKTLDFLSKI